MDFTITPNAALFGVIIIQQGAIMYLCYQDYKQNKEMYGVKRAVIDNTMDIYRMEQGLTTQSSLKIADAVKVGDIDPCPLTLRIPRVEGSSAEAERLL